MDRRFLIFFFVVITMAFVAGKEVNLTQMSTEEKVAQMFIVRGDVYFQEYIDMGVGGYFLDGYTDAESYKEMIERYNKSYIMPFFATDMEGAWNPFVEFYDSKTFSEIKNKTEAYELGKSHAKLLKSMGFTLDFSPVVETKNKVWPDRSFNGNKTEIKQKISAYINGLQKNGIMATAKHYPGGSMIKNPHIFMDRVSEKDLEKDMFDGPIKDNISMIMVGHTIFSERQSSVSPDLIHELKSRYGGIVITDDITMMGLSNSYIFGRKRMMKDLILAGNDIILWTGITTFHHPTPQALKRYIKYLSRKIDSGKINSSDIDKSVEKILKVKGYKVVY